MVINELMEEIRERFRKGERRFQIKEDLMNQGYSEEDIDDTIAKIQHDVVKQLPGVSWIYQLIEYLESKPNAASPKMTLLLMVACIAFLIALAGAFYMFLDPLGTRSSGRDIKRQSDATIIENGLSQYFQKNGTYPDKLDDMVPGSLSDIPRDPRTGKEYAYQPLDGNQNYKLCITLEQEQQQCFYASANVPTIPVVPTDTPVPSFVPQSASISHSPSNAN